MQKLLLICNFYDNSPQLFIPFFAIMQEISTQNWFTSLRDLMKNNFNHIIKLDIITYICDNHLYEMTGQDEHIKILQQLATLSPDEFQIMKGQYLVKTTARDVIEAGRRLEELGIFDFKSSKNEIKITVEYVSAKKDQDGKQKSPRKK